MKNFLSIMILAAVIFFCGQNNFANAKDVWVYKYSNGDSAYIVYESVVYGVKTSFYAKCNIKYVNSSGRLIKSEKLEFNHDEGDWWFGIVGAKSSGGRVYDYEDKTEILNWLKAHESNAKATGDRFTKILAD